MHRRIDFFLLLIIIAILVLLVRVSGHATTRTTKEADSVFLVNSSIGAPAVLADSTGTLGGLGTVGGSLAIDSSGTSPSGASVGTLTLSNPTFIGTGSGANVTACADDLNGVAHGKLVFGGSLSLRDSPEEILLKEPPDSTAIRRIAMRRAGIDAPATDVAQYVDLDTAP